MMKKTGLIIAVIFCVFLAYSSVGATRLLNFESRGFQPDSVYNDDIFVAGNKIKLESVVHGDAFAFCQEFVQYDTISGSLHTFSYFVQILEPIGRSFRGCSANINCNSSVGRNFLAAGKEINIGPEAIIGKNADIVCDKFVFNGEIRGDLTIKGNEATIKGKVKGNIYLENARLIIGSDAVIEGGVYYKSAYKAEIDNSAVIKGEVNWEELEADRGEGDDITFADYLAWVFSIQGYLLLMMTVSLLTFIFMVIPFPAGISILFFWIILLISGNIALMLTKNKASETLSIIDSKFLPSLGLGFIIFFFAPLVSLIIIFTMVGAPLGISALFVFGIAAFLGSVYSSTYLGRKLFGFLGGKTERSPGHIYYSIATVLIVLVSFIPYLGQILAALVIMIGIGGLAQTFKTGRE